MSASNPLSSRCPATAKGTGLQCEHWVEGGGVCRIHGQSRRSEVNRQARLVALRAQLAGGEFEARPAAEVLEGAMHDADAVLQRIKAQVGTGHVDAATLDA